MMSNALRQRNSGPHGEILRLQIAEVANSAQSLCFSVSFKNSGAGPVYVVREFPSADPGGDKSVQLYEVGPPDLSNIIGDDTYSGISGCFEPTRVSHDSSTAKIHHVPPDLQHIFADPAEAAAICEMRRLRTKIGQFGIPCDKQRKNLSILSPWWHIARCLGSHG